jgi:glycosyltransferase involved in cell wall biosynthesis
VKNAVEAHPNIEFKGSLQHDQLCEELRNCNALIFPSTWFEGMPLTLLHAFSTGTPVIASNIGAMSTMIQDQQNGLHFKVGDAEDLAQKLDYWNGLPGAEKEAFGMRSRTIYEKVYTPEAILKSLESIYTEVQN